MTMNKGKRDDKSTMDLAYRQIFEDHWFSLSDDEDEGDEIPADVERLRKAHLLRNMAALNFCHSIKSDHSSTATCHLLQSDLARYEGVTNPRSTDDSKEASNQHIYLNDCMALLQQQCPDKSFDDWRTIVGAVPPTSTYLDANNLPCLGHLVECDAEQLTSEDSKLLLMSTNKGAEDTNTDEVDPPKDNENDETNVVVTPAQPTQPKPRQLTDGERLSQVLISGSTDNTSNQWLTMDTSEVEIVMIDPPAPEKSPERPAASQFHWTDFATNVATSQKVAKATEPTRIHRPSTSKWHQYVVSTLDDSARDADACTQSPKKRRRQGDNDEDMDISSASSANDFKSARQQLIINEHRQNDGGPSSNTTAIKSLGVRRNAQGKFTPPTLQPVAAAAVERTSSGSSGLTTDENADEVVDPRLKHIDPKMVELIRSEIMATAGPGAVGWDDIAGLEYAKTTIREAVVWPMLRPDIFTGLRKPPRGILLFGPPGTGKTLIGKCIAAQSKSTFFSISASSLTSKWIGDGEKMVRALFAVAAVHQPSVVFIDEIDSLLSQRSETEHESSRRLKTEFLVQLDGAATADDERILIVGATNRPQELDEAARRRLVKRLYVPLPDLTARQQILENLLRLESNVLAAAEVQAVAEATDGFSGADMKVLCQEASMGPIRSIGTDQMELIDVGAVRPVGHEDFVAALGRVRSSVSPADLAQYVRWDETYGSGAV